MCYLVFISHGLHWHFVKIALSDYAIILHMVDEKLKTRGD